MAEVNTTDKLSIYPIENFIIIWLDSNINLRYDNYRSIISHLQQFVHLIVPMTDSDRCIDLITDITNEKILLIVSGTLGQKIISLINNLYQIDSIYVFCESKSIHEKWANKEKKIKGVFTKPKPIYDALRRDIRQGEDDLNSFSILSSIEPDQVSIYTQLLKEILIEMEYEPNAKVDFAKFCDSIYRSNFYQLNIIKEFKNDYNQSSSIWWFTRESFICSILNKAFRMRDLEMLIKMGFFIRDIHQEIKRLYPKINKQNRLLVYRGQGITEEDFHKIVDNQNGFLSFNNFLITTTDKDASLTYARNARDNHQLIGILFQMEIESSKALCIPLDKISYYSDTDKEILFSIQNLFRIIGVQHMEDDLWVVMLRLTNNENDESMHINELIRAAVEGENAAERLDSLMNKLQMHNEPLATEMETEKPVEEDVQTEEPSEPAANENMETEQTSTVSVPENEQQDNTLQNPPDS